MTTPEQRQQWRELCEKATPGPWKHDNHAWSPWVHREHKDIRDVVQEYVFKCGSRDDAAFITAARSALPALLDENDALRAENERLKAALVEACEMALQALTGSGHSPGWRQEQRARIAELRKAGGK